MFSDLAHHHHQQHHFPHSTYSLHHTVSKDVPSASPTSFSQSNQRHHFQNASFIQRLERPQQYAHPLRSTAAIPQQIPLQTSYTSAPEISEHMLRRKTPNGTLAAGYDGSPVEWTKRPHTTKHFLMPISNGNGHSTCPYQFPDEFNEHPPLNKLQNINSSVAEQSRTRQHSSTASRQVTLQDSTLIENTKPNLGWRSSNVLPSGMDSVLNQSSVYHHQYNWEGSQHVPTVLQPMWPPCLGPTSIHSPGPYGPYWPNGAFEPYRPASVRDPRYQYQGTENNADISVQLQPAVENYGQWLQANSDSRYSHMVDHQITPSQVVERDTEVAIPLDSSLDSSSRRNPLWNRQNAATTPRQFETPLAYRKKPSPWKDQSSQTFNDMYNNPGFTASNVSASPSYLSENSPTPNNNTQFKDKVLMWAHRIYGNLLTSIEHARRTSPTELQNPGTSHQSIYYGHPPRRPYPSWSNNQSRENRSHRNTQLPSPAFLKKGDAALINSLQASKPHVRRRSEDHVMLSPPSSANPTMIPSSQSQRRWSSREENLRTHPFATQPSYVPPQLASELHGNSPSAVANYAMEMLGRLCQESGLEWTDGMLLTGCLAYGLGDYNKAMKWYFKVLQRDPNNVEAMSNLAATLLALNRRDDAEQYWLRSVKLRPSYFEAIEHLVGLLHEGNRGREAVKVIEYVEQALRLDHNAVSRTSKADVANDRPFPQSNYQSESPGFKEVGDLNSSGYAISPSDNGRMLALVHGKGNMLYQLGDCAGAAQAFEDAILIGAGRRHLGIRGLIQRILAVFSEKSLVDSPNAPGPYGTDEPILLPPESALETSRLVFPPQGRLPGLDGVPDGFGQKAAVSIISNSLLSLAKIYQDGMSSSGAAANAPRATSGVQEILALYYLSLSLQPSPSTANNVGILLASVQQSGRSRSNIRPHNSPSHSIPGVVPGSGVALALAYYDYGLKLDTRHAHLFTNLGSLFKDIGQLNAAIKMYEKAVDCDGNFDIALANLANAVKDQGKVSDAITYYKRAVASNPDFAEAVCGLANALNSVCSWTGRGGITHLGGNRDRWHVDDHGDLYDSKKPPVRSSGWIERVVAIVEKQLCDGESWGQGVLHSVGIEQMLQQLGTADYRRGDQGNNQLLIKRTLEDWSQGKWEGAKVVRTVERATKNLVQQIYRRQYIERRPVPSSYRVRPQLPAALAVPTAPTVLPFHTFTCPLSAKQIRKISQRNGLRVSCSTLRAPWLSPQVYDPPAPPNPHLNVGYISSDFNNHPLAHLMQSVFGLHDPRRVKAFCYATTASDGSVHRQQIEREAPVFYDASSWSIDRIVNRVVADGIHILINLNGYTRGAKNEVFAARPAPIQMSFMGFAGTLGAEWCDYLLADKIAVPPQTLRPWRGNVDLIDQTKDGNNDDDHDDWVYGENIIFTKDTFFCCDHRQSAPDSQEPRISWPEEQRRRWQMRKELFPDIRDDTVILGNFNQLYKVCRPHSYPTRNVQII